MEERTCPICGAELKAEVLGGLCPQCVLGKAMAEEAAPAGAELREEIAHMVGSPAEVEEEIRHLFALLEG